MEKLWERFLDVIKRMNKNEEEYQNGAISPEMAFNLSSVLREEGHKILDEIRNNKYVYSSSKCRTIKKSTERD